MPKFYENAMGKLRPEGADSKSQSELRVKWFSDFENQLRSEYPDLMKDVKLKIVGSVAKGSAAENSDIDIVLETRSADELKSARVRNAIYTVLNKLKSSGKPVFNIEIHTAGSHVINAVSNFRRERKSN